MNDSWYDTAQICTNGHVINSMSVSSPEHNKKFCDKCGAPTITECQECKAPIKGYYHLPRYSWMENMFPELMAKWQAKQTEKEFKRIASTGALDYTDLPLPSFCPVCGEPYPWTEAKLKAAQELTDELSNLSLEEREILKKSIDDIVRDTPQTTVAATRFKRLAAKAGQVAAEGFKDILVDIVSETAKKIIWP